MNSRIEVYAGQVFFLPETKRFVQVRAHREDGVLIIGRPTRYFDDSKTAIGDAPVSPDYLAAAVPVTALDLIEGVIFDGIGWRHESEGALCPTP